MSRKVFEKLWSATTLALILAMLVAPLANARTWTDQADYTPGSIVTISGDSTEMQNGQPPYVDGNTVSVFVQGPNGWADACQATASIPDPVNYPDVVDWSCQVTLSSDPAIAVGPYTYTATSLAADGTTTITEIGIFTDAPRPDCNLTATITFPTNGTTYNVASPSGTVSVTFSWSTSGDYTYTAAAKVDGAEVSTFQTGSMTISNLGVGNHAFQVKADTTANCQNPNRVANATITVVYVPPSDSTPPVISYTLAPASPDGNNGWYKNNILVDWTVTDSESTISSMTGCTDTTVSSDTSGVTYTCTATSAGGTSSVTTVSIKLDKTAPGVAWVGGPADGGSYVYGSVPAAPTCTATDSGSGPDSCGITGYGTTVGDGVVA